MVLLPIGPIVVPFGGSYVESYKVIPKGTATGPMGMVCFNRLFLVSFVCVCVSLNVFLPWLSLLSGLLATRIVLLY